MSSPSDIASCSQAAQSVINLVTQVSAPNYAPLPVVVVRGEGAWVWDNDGRQYLDCLSAYSAVSQGHCHPKIVRALVRQASILTLPSRAFYNDKMGPLLKRLTTMTGLDKALPMNTGAEAVETAIKAARKWAYTHKNIPEDKAEIVVCEGNFHGRTTTIVSFSSEPLYKKNFGPLTPGFVTIPFNNTEALKRAITPHTAAFLVEPIQGEGGIIMPSPTYLAEAQALCQRHNVLMIVDEVQTGLGRTGKMFCYQHSCPTPPDGVIVGKALSGGVYPVSAFISRADVLDGLTPGTHGSTFGGNPLACAVAMAALDVLEEEHLVKRAHDLGFYVSAKLKRIASPLIKEVRGLGLLIGVEFHQAIAHDVALALVKEGILAKDTHHTVLRLAPPLVIDQSDLDKLVTALDRVLRMLGPNKI